MVGCKKSRVHQKRGDSDCDRLVARAGGWLDRVAVTLVLDVVSWRVVSKIDWNMKREKTA